MGTSDQFEKHMGFRDEPLRRAQAYANRNGLTLGKELGVGGVVFVTEEHIAGRNMGKRSAVKAHQRETEYLRERDVYMRLLECDIAKIRGFDVPQLLAYDDELWVIEMTVVSRPFVLDFG